MEPEIDSKVMAESPQVLRAGMWFSVKDTDLGLAGTDGSSYLILIDSVEVTDKPDTIRSFKVTLRNNKEDNVFVRMQRQIAQTSASVQSERRSQTMTSVSEVPTKSGGGGEYIDTSDFVTLSTEQTITAPKTFAGDVTFGAAREDGTYSKLLIPSSSGPGIYDLYVSTDPVDGEVPAASGGIDEDELWTILGGSSTNKVIDPSHIPVIPVEKVSGLSTALSSYATQEWVENKGYLTSVSLSTISDLHSSWDTLLQSAPDFYSKSSVYSKSEADGRYVGIANEQTITGRKTFSALLTASAGLSGTNADLSGYISATKVYLPFSGGNKVYDILISTQPIDGEAPSEGGGINEDELWSILGGSGTQKIGASHIPPLSELSGNLDSSRITGLDSALTSYAKKDGSNATGRWPISISGNAASADISNYLYLNPNSDYHAAQNDAVPANGRFAIYDANANTTAGGSDGYIMAFRWPSGNWVSQIYIDVDPTGIMALRHRDNANVWSEWFRILHSDNIGSYALTPSNYTSTLDSRYVKKAGDTMTGILELDRAGESIIRYWISGVKKGATGYLNGTGAYLYSWPASKYLNITDAGSLLFGGSTVWHSGNDGAGSGLDADLLDGYHASSFLLKSGGTMTGALTLGDSSRLNFVVGGTTRLGIYDDGTYVFYGDPSYKTGIRGTRIILQNVVGGPAIELENNDVSFPGKLYIPSSSGNRVFDAYIA